MKEVKKNKKGNPGNKNGQTPGFSKESLRKKFRWSEYLSEKIITAVSFFSITIIILIFVFVFKEAAPIFYQKKTAEKNNPKQEVNISKKTNTSTGENKPEQYGGDEQKPEQYGGEEKPEIYGGESDCTSTMQKQQSAKMQQDIDTAAAHDFSISKKDIANWTSLTSTQWQPVSEHPRYGMIPLIVGTLKVTFIAILIATPLAILAAIYTACMAPNRIREYIKPAIEILAGFPSIVIGFFALMVMATFFQDILGYASRLNAFVGGVAMALAAIPIIYTITEDALTAIPRTYTEASLALGANRWQTAFFVLLPAATPGIFAAVLLGIGRVFGETMIVLMATGNAALTSLNPFESVRTLAATIGAEMAEVVFGETHYNVLFLIGALLFIFTFALNAIAEFYVKNKLVKKIQGK